MKKVIFIFVFFITAFSLFAQRIYKVGILPFEVPPAPPANGSGAVSDSGVSDSDAAEATRLVIAGLSSCKTLSILEGEGVKAADYLVKGQITRLSTGQNNQIVLTATISAASTGAILNTSKEQAPTLDAISMSSFCTQLTDYIPYIQFIVGKWQSTIDMNDGPVICILEFRPDRTVRVQQYDTWESNGTNILKYQAIGTGTFTFAGYHMPRTFNIGGQGILTNATLGINLTLEDALPKYPAISVSGLRMVYNDSWTGFELVNAGLPCGDNYTGPSVYPSAKVFYTKFTKIQ